MARVNKVSECAKPMQHAFTVDGRNKVCLIKHKITKYDKFRRLLNFLILILSVLKESLLFFILKIGYTTFICSQFTQLNKNTIH